MNWNALVAATLNVYQQAGKNTVKKIGRGCWIALLPLVYTPIIFFSASVFGRMGFAGGLLVGLVMALCTGSYLYFIDGVVHGQRVQPQDLLDSWRPNFGSVITILFFLAIVRLFLSMIPGGTSSQALYVLVHLVMPILLSPVTEIIYQGRSDGFAMIQESVEFLRESGVEWFLPLIALVFVLSVALALPPITLASSLFFPLDILAMPMQLGRSMFMSFGIGFWNSTSTIMWAIGSSVLLYAVMVFRGLLFKALAGGSRRQRIFRARMN